MVGFLEKNVTAASRVLEKALANERWTRAEGFLQSVDGRVKIVGFVLLILFCSLTKRTEVLIILYGLAVMLAALSRINLGAFTVRVWIFIPIFSCLIALPALFLTPGTRAYSWGPLTLTREGITTALFLILRVSTSVSFAVLLVLTTPWNSLMQALRDVKVPAVVVALLSISYRYLLLLLRTLSELLLARKSRVIGDLPHRQELGFASRSAGVLFLKSLHIAEGVQMAMVSRGYDEENRGTRQQKRPVTGMKDKTEFDR